MTRSEPKIPSQKSKTLMLDSALLYLERGWNVIPVTKDKRPYLDSWEEYQRRRITQQEVREMWGRWPNAGIAMLTGALSGVVVIDADDAEGLKCVKPYLTTETLTVTTGRGGKHYYFKHPGVTVPCAVRFMPGTDCRGDAGYVVVPPSTHRSGRTYRWEDPKTPIVPLPPTLLQEIQRKGQSRKLDAKDWEADIPDGERDQELTRRAGRLLQAGMSAAGCLGAISYINVTYCKPPLEDKQVQKIVQSIAGREKEKRAKETTPTTSKFTVLTQREMLRQYSEGEERWTVAEWLPEASCGLLVAPPGEYKTWILEALAFSVSTGRKFLGRWKVTGKGPVLFIQQEDPWWMLESRLARMFPQQVPRETAGKNPHYELDCRFVKELDSMPVYWYTDRKLSFADKSVMAKMEQKIAELRPRLVMIDPLYTAVDTRDYMAEGAQKMTALKLMRDRYGCSFIIAHHTTVAGSTSQDRSAIWGSQFLNAWLEFGWRMPKGNKHGNVVIRHFKSCEDPKRVRVKFNITEFAFGTEIDEDYKRSTSERIEEMILDGAGVPSVRDIADELGCGKSTVQRVIHRMGLESDEKGGEK